MWLCMVWEIILKNGTSVNVWTINMLDLCNMVCYSQVRLLILTAAYIECSNVTYTNFVNKDENKASNTVHIILMCSMSMHYIIQKH
jgi:hypothetical protein